jgi:hypothetical protein
MVLHFWDRFDCTEGVCLPDVRLSVWCTPSSWLVPVIDRSFSRLIRSAPVNVGALWLALRVTKGFFSPFHKLYGSTGCGHIPTLSSSFANCWNVQPYRLWIWGSCGAVTPCSLEIARRFRGTHRLHLQGRRDQQTQALSKLHDVTSHNTDLRNHLKKLCTVSVLLSH